MSKTLDAMIAGALKVKCQSQLDALDVLALVRRGDLTAVWMESDGKMVIGDIGACTCGRIYSINVVGVLGLSTKGYSPVELEECTIDPDTDRCDYCPPLEGAPTENEPSRCHCCENYAKAGEEGSHITVDTDPGNSESGPRPCVERVWLCDKCSETKNVILRTAEVNSDERLAQVTAIVEKQIAAILAGWDVYLNSCEQNGLEALTVEQLRENAFEMFGVKRPMIYKVRG